MKGEVIPRPSRAAQRHVSRRDVIEKAKSLVEPQKARLLLDRHRLGRATKRRCPSLQGDAGGGMPTRCVAKSFSARRATSKKALALDHRHSLTDNGSKMDE